MTPGAWVSTGKIIAVIAIGIGLFFSVRQVLSWKEAAETNAATVTAQNQTGEATIAITGDLGQATTAGNEAEHVVSNARNTYQHYIQESVHADPSVTDWRSQPVPQRMRDAARAARCARDGSRGGAAGCPRDDGTEGAARRGGDAP